MDRRHQRSSRWQFSWKYRCGVIALLLPPTTILIMMKNAVAEPANQITDLSSINLQARTLFWVIEKSMKSRSKGINTFLSNIAVLHWNKALWLDVSSHMTICNQSECIISAKHTYATQNFVAGICHKFQRVALLPLYISKSIPNCYAMFLKSNCRIG